MNCPACGAQNRERALFCSNCGSPLASAKTAPPAPVAVPAPVEPPPPPPSPSPSGTLFQQRMAEFSAANSAERLSKQALEELAERKKVAEAEIDDFLRKVGVADPLAVVDEHGWRHLQLGSAHGRVGIVEDEHEIYLHVEAYLMPLPSDGDLILPLLRELLEINTLLRGAERLGIANEAVFVVNVRPVVGMESDDFARSIHGVMSLADTLDGQLLEKYGGTSKPRVPPGSLSAAEPSP